MDFNEELDKLEDRFRSLVGSADEDSMEEVQEVFTQVTEAVNYWNRLQSGEEKQALAEEISERIHWLKKQL